METTNLKRFLKAQETTYATALHEIKNGQKQSHWMWFIFPQLKGLGFTDYNIFYGLDNLAEAHEYYNHPVLGPRLIQITKAVLKINNKSALQIMGKPDERKLRSCMTLFSVLPQADNCFKEVIKKFYEGRQDEKTLSLLAIS